MSETYGTSHDDIITASQNDDVIIIGLAGDDTITGSAGDDVLVGDFLANNILIGTEGATSFAQYSESDAWTTSTDQNGATSMSQTVQTQPGAVYTVSFDLAANYGAGTVSGAVEVLWNGVVIDTFDTNSGAFSAHDVTFEGTDGPGELTFRSVESAAGSNGPEINTDGPVFYYETVVEIDGVTLNVKAFAPGQSNIYQVLDGQLNVYDVETETYTPAGADATVNINAIGFNQEDDMIYGIAVGDGYDALGKAVQPSDLVIIDAAGDCYVIGSTPYKAWTADFDHNGNLWTFHSSMDRVTMIDVDNLDADGNPVSVTFKFPSDMVTDQMWDVAFDAASQCFYGIVKPTEEGGPGQLYTIDISNVSEGGEPTFTSIPIEATLIDGEMVSGLPAMTFGALVIDGDGNLYAGGNGGDHDLDNNTATSGGIYLIETDPDTGALYLTLVADAPKAYSNDGAIDPRSIDPFAEVDESAGILIREPEMIEVATPSQSYDDDINGGGGQDLIDGGLGEDVLVGASLGDTISGGDSDDTLYGGAGPNAVDNGLISVYDDAGIRYDQYGNLLAEDDDVLSGGSGNDLLDGSAGHDILYGGTGDDSLSGGSGSDILYGGLGADVMTGGGQDDTLFGGEDDDVLDGGSGNDLLYGDDGADILNSGSDDDAVYGGKGNDTIDANSGNDYVEGGSGDDRIKSGSGDDVVLGGDGKDYINAHSGADIIDGGAGSDKIYAGTGEDIVTGGSGSDTFVFRSTDLDGQTNTIKDFTRDGSENDRIDLRDLDVLAAGQSEQDWIDANVTVSTGGDITIHLGDTEIVLLDHLDQGELFVSSVTDGLMF
ncbi:DUF6923 family protein [Flavimaricola marinus]|uniref:DUF6923 family protein n=1 Tax=Flavimaricola marinus TaxID=1819565 RepID=UPI000B8B2771|nr:hypothetical protein [Flavimaricola marinus]